MRNRSLANRLLLSKSFDDVQMTERYTHPNQDLKKEAVEILAQKSGELAHICHKERKKKTRESAIIGFSIN